MLYTIQSFKGVYYILELRIVDVYIVIDERTFTLFNVQSVIVVFSYIIHLVILLCVITALFIVVLYGLLLLLLLLSPDITTLLYLPMLIIEFVIVVVPVVPDIVHSYNVTPYIIPDDVTIIFTLLIIKLV